MATSSDVLVADPGLLERAMRHCTRQLQENPDNPVALRSLGELRRKLGDLEGAAAVYDRLFRLDPGDREAGHLGALLAGVESAASLTGTHAAPFVRVRDFLPKDQHESLVPFVIARRDRFVSALVKGVPRPDFRQTLELRGNFKGREELPADWEGREPFWDRVMNLLPRVIAALRIGTGELFPQQVGVRAYLDGHFYKVHMDAPAKSAAYAHRVINFVYFFHRSPRPFTGGELLLFDSDLEANTFARDRFTRVVPEGNSIIFFPSPYWHSVLPVHSPSGEFADSRFAIIGHFSKRAAGGPVAEAGVGAGVTAAGSSAQPW